MGEMNAVERGRHSYVPLLDNRMRGIQHNEQQGSKPDRNPYEVLLNRVRVLGIASVHFTVHAYVFSSSFLQVATLQQLFPAVDPQKFVERAPMLLALSEKTLKTKNDAWQHILERRLDAPWEEVRYYVQH